MLLTYRLGTFTNMMPIKEEFIYPLTFAHNLSEKLDISMHEPITKMYERFALLVSRFTLLASALAVIISAAAAASLAFLESLLTGLALGLVVILTVLSELFLQSGWGVLGQKLLGKCARESKKRAVI